MMRIICHPQMGPMLTQCPSLRNLYLENLGIYVFFNHHPTWVVIKSFDTSVTLQMSSWLAALYKGTGSGVNKLHLLARSLVAKYSSSTATLSNKSLWHLAAGSPHYSITPCLEHAHCILHVQHTVYYILPHHFWWQQCTLSDVSERFCVMFLAPTQLRHVI